jgi:hypothetical protein
MYTEKEVEELLKMQKKVCSDIASANWGSHVGKSVLKSPDVPLVKPCSLGSVSGSKPNIKAALNASLSAIYFDDGSDFKTYHYEVISSLTGIKEPSNKEVEELFKKHNH